MVGLCARAQGVPVRWVVCGGGPPSVVGLGVALVDGMEALCVAPLEVLGGLCCDAAWVAV